MYSRLKQLLIKHRILYGIYKALEELFDRMTDHHIFLIAAGIAFNILLYIIPLFLVAVYVINYIFGIELIAGTLEKFLIEMFPPTTSARDLIHTIIDEVYLINSKSSLAGWIGLIALLWLSSTLFSSLRTGLNSVFHIPSPRIFVFYRLKDILLTIILAIFILISSYIMPLTSMIIDLARGSMPDLVESFVSQAMVRAVSFLITLIFFYTLFRFVPNVKIPHFTRLFSTILSVILIELSRQLFAWYLGSISNFGKFYGTYAVLVSMALWIYYFSLIILASAEIGQFAYDIKENRRLLTVLHD